MTGPAVPPDEDREALAAALAERRRTWDPEELQEIVTDLVPVVDAIARRRAAEELRAAGDQIDSSPWQSWSGREVAAGLRVKADALTDYEEAGPQPGAPSGTLTG